MTFSGTAASSVVHVSTSAPAASSGLLGSAASGHDVEIGMSVQEQRWRQMHRYHHVHQQHQYQHHGTHLLPPHPEKPQRIRYREQGVDELLQLKLHQAIAATDDVPEGATIVLATGDGNVGQFNEDGFLGPVRTALRRGWKVELYAWEEGLSRAWRKEFGPGSEWEQSGRFRIISMEQFAAYLVKGC